MQQQQGYYGEVRLPVADAVKYSSSYSVSYVDILLEGVMTPVVCASGVTSVPVRAPDTVGRYGLEEANDWIVSYLISPSAVDLSPLLVSAEWAER